MNFIELCKKRYSVRKFAKTKVEEDKIDIILEAARLAPTAHNYQPQRIVVIKGEEALTKLKECTSYHFNAPLAFLICWDKEVSWKDEQNRDSGLIDTSIVATQMMLAAANLNLGSTCVGSFSYEKTREAFNIPDKLEIAIILPVGNLVENSRPSRLHDERFSIKQTTYIDEFK